MTMSWNKDCKLLRYGFVALGAFVVGWSAIATTASVRVKKGPEAVPGFIMRRDSSKRLVSSWRSWSCGGG